MSITLADQLREARTAAGLTQKKLGELLGLSHAQISRIEGGERETTPDVIGRWLEACGYKLDVFPLSGATGAPARELAAALSKVDDEGTSVATLLLRVWPTLSPRERRALVAELRVYEEEQDLGNRQS